MRFSLKFAMLAMATLGVALLGTAQGKDDEIKDIKGCMAFTKTRVAKDDLPARLKASSPDWAPIQKDTKQWLVVAETLGKQTPPKGSAESWKKQTARYLENVRAVDDAAEKKDAKAATKAIATIGMSCGACHSQHRPKK